MQLLENCLPTNEAFFSFYVCLRDNFFFLNNSLFTYLREYIENVSREFSLLKVNELNSDSSVTEHFR